MRIAPPEFVAELQRMFGAMYSIEWRDHLSRWVVLGPTADGRIVEQVWGWFWREVEDPETKVKSRQRIDSAVDGLPPFRDITDRAAQLEMLESMEQTYPFNREDGDGTLRRRFSRITLENMALRRKRQLQRAQTYMELIQEVDLKRPWLKDHQRAKGAVLISSAVGTRRTALYDHQNGRVPSPS